MENMSDLHPASLAGVLRNSPRLIRALRVARVLRKRWKRDGQRGATTLEWTLLVAAIALPSYGIILLGLETLFAHYRMITTLNGLPFP